MIRLPSEILTALETVLDYCWNDESRSYEETPEEDRHNHIFHSLLIMQSFVNAPSTSAVESDFDTTDLKHQLAKRGMIANIWSIEDVQSVRPDLTDESCLQVLENCERYHDAEIGINWDVIRIHARDLFPAPRDLPTEPTAEEEP